jgi:uncharacterized protein involved in response to NO
MTSANAANRTWMALASQRGLPCTLRMPLLWILDGSYTWLALSIRLLAMPVLWTRHRQSAFHVLAIGSIAGLIMGMIIRIALDHTGRMLKADASEIVMYC